MKPGDRDARLYTGSMLLTLLKLHGGSARFAATYLGVSPTTVSNWLNVKETESRGQGVPSDEHLRKLVALLVWQIRQGLGALQFLMGNQQFRMREQILLTRALTNNYSQAEAHLRGQCKHWDSLLADMRSMSEKYGPGVLDITFAPMQAQWGSGDSLQDSVETAQTVSAEQFFKELEISDEEIRANDKDLQSFFAERNRQVLERLRQRRQKNSDPGQSRSRSAPAPTEQEDDPTEE